MRHLKGSKKNASNCSKYYTKKVCFENENM